MLSILLIYLKLIAMNAALALVSWLIAKSFAAPIVVTALFWLGFIGIRTLRYPYKKYTLSRLSKKFENNEVETLRDEDGFVYRDLNKNGKLDKYEDSRLPVEERVEDLLSQMTTEEKCGLLFNHFTFVHDPEKMACKQDDFYDTYPEEMIYRKNMNTFTIFGGGITPEETAKVTNKVQRLAEKTRLGIPVTFATDPRHHYDAGVGAGAAQEGISRWPEQLGLTATGSDEVIENFADVCSEELRAQGIHMLLGPMADTATSPKWGRNYGTFGDDAETVAHNLSVFVKRASSRKNENRIICQIKHFPGAGPQKDGWDAHFPYGKEQVYPGGAFDEHLKPFIAGFEAGATEVMPYYGVPEGTKYEEVGFNFNKGIITDLLRNELGFKGVIATDFSIIIGTKVAGFDVLFPKCWGVEKLSYSERLKKAFDAGVDQIGGETCVSLLVDLVKSGKISEERIDESARRVLREKFELGLFEDPFVDEKKAETVCGSDKNMALGLDAQKKSFVLLRNENSFLPLKKGLRIYAENVNRERLENMGVSVVDAPENADAAIIRKEAPQTKQYRYIYEKLFKQGKLSWNEKEINRLEKIMNSVPTLLDVGLDRPVVIGKLKDKAAAITGHFGAEEEVFLSLVFGEFRPTGKLPFSLPASDEAVEKHKEDLPLSKEEASWMRGDGLSYEK